MNDLFTGSTATLSACGTYRYDLTRMWDSVLAPVCFVMLNPSTADADEDDPTIRRCVGFARSWGAGGVRVYNLFALRATVPQDMLAHPDPVGPDNDAFLLGGTRRHDYPLRVIAAWGAHGGHRGRDRRVVKLLTEAGIALECLGLTKDGHPKHPLYVAADTALVPYAGRK